METVILSGKQTAISPLGIVGCWRFAQGQGRPDQRLRREGVGYRSACKTLGSSLWHLTQERKHESTIAFVRYVLYPDRCSEDLYDTRRREGTSQSLPKLPKPAEPGYQKTHDEESPKTMPLNFKVSAEFRRDFKMYAAQHNKKLNQLLYEAFAALREKHEA